MTIPIPAMAGLLLSLVALQAGQSSPAPPAAWRSLAPGLDLRLMDGGGSCRRGSATIAVVRISTERWRLQLFHESEPGASDRPARDVEGWREATGAAVMMNASQYYPNHVPMGLFVKEGRNLGTPTLKHWKGVLVAEPEPGAAVPGAD